MKKFIDFAHCTRHRLVREIEEFNYSDTSLLRLESSDGMVFIRPENSSRSFLPIYLSSNASENVEIYVKFKQLTQASQAFANNGGGLVMCSSKESTSAENAFCFVFGSNSNSGTDLSATWRNYLYLNSVSTNLATGSIAEKTTNEQSRTWKHMKAKKEGASFKTKAWWDGEIEPEYSAGFTAPGLQQTGYYGFELSSRATVVHLQYLAIATEGDSVDMLPPENRIISGTLLNPDNSVASGQTVRLYHSYTGALLGRLIADINGAYEFVLPIDAGELVQIVGVDALGNEWKPPIHETYPVL